MKPIQEIKTYRFKTYIDHIKEFSKKFQGKIIWEIQEVLTIFTYNNEDYIVYIDRNNKMITTKLPNEIIPNGLFNLNIDDDEAIGVILSSIYHKVTEDMDALTNDLIQTIPSSLDDINESKGCNLI